MRIWARLFKDNRMLKDFVYEDKTDSTRTKKVFKALDESVKYFDLATPIWLDSNIKEFKNHAKTRFRRDSFIEEVDFDYMEFFVIDED